MAVIGEVTGSEVSVNKDGLNNVRLIQTEITDPDDIQTVQLVRQAGEDYNPPVGSKMLIVQAGKSWKLGIIFDDVIDPSMAEGERKIYSIAGGIIKAFINWLADGVIEINGNTDFAVAFNDLKAGFDQLVTDYNAHTHSAPGGATGTPQTPTTASVDAAKVNNVKLP